ncbi:putative Gamma-interferon-inducible lysosomal thiol reductase precursor [Hibiscus syriacus]|uniref:Gamma-interferon-inducible lysosomal thiol reductase n=1 Tax=Hibiscus syriacus TaxID=106335 RepID=A0A6A2ZXQ0_HIBSY|nr:putative Gamma-interferon-inducible lysosomal thiol reductase precursor [Hibiscus syriacus]
MSEWLRSQTRNLMGNACAVSLLLTILTCSPRSTWQRDMSEWLRRQTRNLFGLYCAGCARFITNDLVKVFHTDLYTIVNLRLVPWGNADIVGDLIRCQHGEDECDLNAIHSCVIHLWPDEKTRFGFVRCTEEQRLKEVPVSSEEAMLPAYLSIIPLVFSPKSSILRSTLDIECLHLLLQHGNETESLNPPYEYAPWVVVNKQPLKTDYEIFVKYVCDAYQGDPKPEACNAQSCSVGSTNRKMATKIHSGCYAEQS